jgi:hypothetical protein
MSYRRPGSGPLASASALAVAALVAAACADTPLAPPAPAATAGALAAAAFGPDPAFAVIGIDGFVQPFTHTSDVTIPMAPAPWKPAGWSVVRHQRDPRSWYEIEPMAAWHGTSCQRPDDAVEPLHRVSGYDDMVFLCRNHMMTANNSSDYGVIYITPGYQADFSAGTAVVRFDVATKRESLRDWIDLWLTPYEDNLVAPLDATLPDLQGEPRRAVHLRMATDRASAFTALVTSDFATTELPVADTTSYETAFAARRLAPSATRRDTFELHISRTHVKFGMPRYNLWWVDADIPGGLDWSRAVMQFGHHSFRPIPGQGGPTTWHWDNIGAAPATPFTIIRADRRYVDGSTPAGAVTFPTAAPANAFLRAAVFGTFEVRFAGADRLLADWQPVQLQAQRELAPNRFAAAWMPIPPGTTRAEFRATPARVKGGRNTTAWMARDIEIWAEPLTATFAGVAAAGR